MIEHLAANDIDCGLEIERYNMRGIYSEALYEGGDQERALANENRGWADSRVPVGPEWLKCWRLSLRDGKPMPGEKTLRPNKTSCI